MTNKQSATAGTTESSDIMITLKPNQQGIQVELESNVKKQFGEHITALITDILQRLAITNVKVEAVDKGALDCTIKARTIAAAYRLRGESDYEWEAINSWND
ncbi:citrate lyase acyl carrier protein [Lactiplantibacillus garii]|uniref:Citrate lyase acyl carrier protein n=1 Tax=Lactiplantibacillus garii TaxID=2306423 RepID=A0A426D4U0_9LACO|nr:citrate lyase acyl carrier protein [Lactiplantibacillus garii]RRK09636.1 citrate lyase acyl carrier protein [Lactiplantibacillus garii]